MSRKQLCLLVGLFAAISVPAWSTTMGVSVQNNTGGDVYDIHITFIGTGGTIHNLVAVSPVPQTMDSGPGNEVNGAWTPALGAGHYWEAEFDVDFTDLSVAEAYWTDAQHGFVANIPLTDVVFGKTPEPSSELLVGTALTLLGWCCKKSRVVSRGR